MCGGRGSVKHLPGWAVETGEIDALREDAGAAGSADEIISAGDGRNTGIEGAVIDVDGGIAGEGPAGEIAGFGVGVDEEVWGHIGGEGGGAKRVGNGTCECAQRAAEA